MRSPPQRSRTVAALPVPWPLRRCRVSQGALAVFSVSCNVGVCRTGLKTACVACGRLLAQVAVQPRFTALLPLRSLSMPSHLRMTSAGLPKEAVRQVYRAAITQASASDSSQQLSNGFVAALTQVGDVAAGQSLLDNLLVALAGTIKASGCGAAEKFAAGLFAKLSSLDPDHAASVRQAFIARPAIAACKYAL